jgi:Josephin
LCGLHALNNALQRAVFTDIALYSIAFGMHGNVERVVGAAARPSVYTAASNDGYFSTEVLEAALNTKQFALRGIDEQRQTAWLNGFRESMGMFVVNRNRAHWFAIRKFKVGLQAYKLDSLMEEPVQFNDIRQQVNFVTDIVFQIVRMDFTAQVDNFAEDGKKLYYNR